jgi:hypothetical protein
MIEDALHPLDVLEIFDRVRRLENALVEVDRGVRIGEDGVFQVPLRIPRFLCMG